MPSCLTLNIIRYGSRVNIGLFVGSVLWHINLCRLFYAKSILYKYKWFDFKEFSLAQVHSLNAKNRSISNNSLSHKFTV